MSKSKAWLEVDREGLSQVLGRRGPEFVLYELVQNAWDADGTTKVGIELHKKGKHVTLMVEDNSPKGWCDLTHAWTLFAPSEKKADPTKRGRFNLGEKLVLALAKSAKIQTMQGSVWFGADGRTQTKDTRPAGTLVVIEFADKFTHADADELVKAALRLLPPDGIETTLSVFAGELPTSRMTLHTTLRRPMPVARCSATLPTEVSDEHGNLRPTQRKTDVEWFNLQTSKAYLYEMGIPVVEIDGGWSINVHQKVPLNFDRDNVRPAYARHLAVLTANTLHPEDVQRAATETWAKVALEDARITVEAAEAILKGQFGDKVVSHDPRDPESSKLAVAQGFTVVHGRQLSAAAWEVIRGKDLLSPASEVTPSNAFVTTGPDGIPALHENDWTPAMRKVVSYCARVANFLRRPIYCDIYRAPTIRKAAWYGAGPTGHLSLNVGVLGSKWFEEPNEKEIDALLIHELAHHVCDDHLDAKFHDELCRLGAALKGCKEGI